jgi:hypothetical protein
VKSVRTVVSLLGVFGLLSFALPVVGQDLAAVTIVDQRSEESLTGRRSSVFSAIAFLPEKAVKPAPVVQLQDALSRRATGPLALVISEMRVIDFFPVRLNAGMPTGGIASVISERLVDSRTDWSLIDAIGLSEEEDSVICLLAGTVNGREISVAAHSPYKLGGGAMVRSNENFKAAVTSSIDQVAQKIVDLEAAAQATQ